MSENHKTYDLEERTALYGESIITFCKNSNRDGITTPVITQLLRSGTSIGANYMEANGASSRKDFINKIYICKKESQEAKYWLRMTKQIFPDKIDQITALWKEAQELTLIFQKIIISSKANAAK